MRLLLFLFLPAVLAMEYPRAPGMYPPEEIGSPSSSGTVPPSPYGGGQHEGPYEFYYEKEPSAPGSNSLSGPRPPGGSERGEADFGRASSISAGSQGRNSGPVPPGGFFSSSSGEQHGSNSVRPGGSSSRHGSTDSNYDFGYEKGPNAGKSGNSYRPSSGLKEQTNGEGLNPIDPYEHGNGRNQPGKEGTNEKQSREELTGGKGYRADKDSDFGVEKNFKGEEAPSLRSSSEDFGKALPNDLTEVSSEIDKLERLAVTESDQEESFKSTTGKTPDTFKPCCACCKGEVRTRQPVLGGGYIESTSSQIAHVPGGLSGVAGQGYPTGPANPAGAGLSNGGSSPVYAQTPNFVPTQYGGSYGGGGGGCGCAPQICCQIAQPCCMPSLPCCPPPPPIPCCPQISICCQPIVPCCISLPQICLPTIPLCFRSCPACPCRRRRSVEDPRHHSRTKRQSCMRRVKRQSNCRQCNGLNGLSQPSGGCGTCNGSHRRVKRLGCLPCGRKKREALAEEEHIRQKRSCLPCLGGRKKRQVPNGGSCQKCSLLQTFITRQKRSLNCGPCGGRRKKRAPSSSSCSCASSTPHNSVLRMKRAIVSNYDELDTCDRNCCDYSKCWELRAKKLDLKNFTS